MTVRDDVEERKKQLARLGLVIEGDPTPLGTKVKAEKQEKPKKQVKTSKTFTKTTQVKPRPQKQRVQKSASPTGAKFLNFIENVLN